MTDSVPQRVCFRLKVRTELIDEYVRCHAQVWPRMLAELEASGRRNYSLFLDTDGELTGYYETDDDGAAQAYLDASETATRWEAEMAVFFDDLGTRADQGARRLTEVFNLDAQLHATRPSSPTGR